MWQKRYRWTMQFWISSQLWYIWFNINYNYRKVYVTVKNWQLVIFQLSISNYTAHLYMTTRTFPWASSVMYPAIQLNNFHIQQPSLQTGLHLTNCARPCTLHSSTPGLTRSESALAPYVTAPLRGYRPKHLACTENSLPTSSKDVATYGDIALSELFGLGPGLQKVHGQALSVYWRSFVMMMSFLFVIRWFWEGDIVVLSYFCWHQCLAEMRLLTKYDTDDAEK